MLLKMRNGKYVGQWAKSFIKGHIEKTFTILTMSSISLYIETMSLKNTPYNIGLMRAINYLFCGLTLVAFLTNKSVSFRTQSERLKISNKGLNRSKIMVSKPRFHKLP